MISRHQDELEPLRIVVEENCNRAVARRCELVKPTHVREKVQVPKDHLGNVSPHVLRKLRDAIVEVRKVNR